MIKLSPALGAFIADLLRLSAGRPTDLLHITVLPIGERSRIDAATFDRIIAILDAVRLPSFRIAFDYVGGFDRTILLPSETLRGALAFYDALVATFAEHGLWLARSYRFRPHITLAYHSDTPGQIAIDPISWRVEEICLVESVVGETRHIEHGRWALAGMDRAA